MKKIILTVPVALAMFICLVGCNPSPKSAAKEVCECLSESRNKNIAECQELARKYEESYKGDDQREFSKELADCTMGSLMGN